MAVLRDGTQLQGLPMTQLALQAPPVTVTMEVRDRAEVRGKTEVRGTTEVRDKTECQGLMGRLDVMARRDVMVRQDVTVCQDVMVRPDVTGRPDRTGRRDRMVHQGRTGHQGMMGHQGRAGHQGMMGPRDWTVCRGATARLVRPVSPVKAVCLGKMGRQDMTARKVHPDKIALLVCQDQTVLNCFLIVCLTDLLLRVLQADRKVLWFRCCSCGSSCGVTCGSQVRSGYGICRGFSGACLSHSSFGWWLAWSPLNPSPESFAIVIDAILDVIRRR